MTAPGGLGATATAVLRFDASAVRPGVMDANSALQQLYGTVRDNWWGIRNLGEVLAGLGGVISGGLGVATAAAIGFEQSTMTIFKNVSDSATLLPSRMKEIRAGLEQLSTTSPVALDNLVKIAQQGALFGIASDQVVEFTKKVADLTVGTNLTVADIGNLKKVLNEFNLPVDQIDKLGSALFVAEKNTSATAPAILNLTTQYGSLLHEIGATAQEAIALSAVFVSQGARGQAAATATQNLFTKIGQAEVNNQPLFENYAKVAGLTADNFSRLYRSDPTEAIVKVAGGLANVRHNAGDLSEVMQDLGQKNARSITALLDLASASNNAAAGTKSLQQVIDATNAAYQDTSAYQKEVARQSTTTAAQIQILKNDFKVLTIGIGSEVLPALNGVVHVLQDVVLGLGQMPDGVRKGIVLFGGLTGGTLLLVGALALIVPRLVQAASAVRGLGESMLAYEAVQQQAIAITLEQEGADAAAELSSVKWGRSRRAAVYEVLAAEKARQASITETIALETAWLGAETTSTIALEAATAAEEASAAMLALRAEMNAAAIAGDGARLRVLAAQLPAYTVASAAATDHALATAADAEAALGAASAMEVEIAATAELAAAQEAGSAIAIAFGAALDFATGPIGLVVIGITAIVAGLAALMYFMGRATKATDDFKDANTELSRQLVATSGDVGKVTNAFLIQQPGMLEAIQTVNRLGISTAAFFEVMRGAASAAVSADVVSRLNEAVREGVPGARAAADALQHYNDVVISSQKAANQLAAADKELGITGDGATASSLHLADAHDKAKSAADVRANAELQLVGAERALKDADQAVADAEQRLADARQNLADRSFNIKDAEDAVTDARISEKDATEALATAEHDLGTARADAARQLQNDKLALAKAKAQEVLDTLKLKKAQDDLNGAQNASDADLASKTERLADARRLLFQATKEAADAEYNLMYLKEQGASAEDIAAAERRVRDAQTNTKSAQVQVDDLGAQSTQTKDPSLAAAQASYDLASAQASLAASQQSVFDLTSKVAQEQKDAASDKAYKDATDKVTEAHIHLRQAQDRTREATRALNKEMASNPEARAYSDAQKGVEDALYNRAKAVVDVKKYTFELGGTAFTTGQEVAAMHQALLDQAGAVTGPVHDALVGYADQLDAVAKSISGMDTTIPPLKGPDTTQATNNVHAVGAQIKGLEKDHTGILNRIFDSHGLGPSLRVSLHELGGDLTSWAHGIGPAISGGFDAAWKAVIKAAQGQFDLFFKSLPPGLQVALAALGGQAGNILSGALKGTLMILEGPINLAVDAVNGMASALQWVNKITPFADPFSVHHLDHVSFHAEGGVFDKPHLGMVGEAGPEAIVPLMDFVRMMNPVRELAWQMASTQRTMEALVTASRYVPAAADGGGVYKKYSVVVNNPSDRPAEESIVNTLQAIDFLGG